MQLAAPLPDMMAIDVSDAMELCSWRITMQSHQLQGCMMMSRGLVLSHSMMKVMESLILALFLAQSLAMHPL